ncbi:MAG: 4Fe-4S dicluster domain-containing protein [Firmicutes bacterium]|nr:4Fe-4S dicluster domain-containing protein [Bacillota bacterium]MBR0441515.1 4Fe-4S dicluster domain-containing protein [Bacillota bacterium]
MQAVIKKKAKELLECGTVDRVLGWKAGEFFYDLTPAVFTTPEEIDKDFVFSVFSGANMSKYLIEETKKEGKVAAFIKPCDSYSLVQLQKEHRIKRENCYIVGIACDGMCDMGLVREAGIKGATAVSEKDDKLVLETIYGEKEMPKEKALLERCVHCKSKKVVDFDEMIGENGEENPDCGRFDEVERLEAMTPDERFAFWRSQLSRCIRCNACRNVCPACSCEKCVFDNPDSGIAQKAAASDFEENNFHIIRAYHVAGRCTDCGECSRVCPQNIPLHLLNRKFIKDMNELYGFYQAGADFETKPPIMNYTTNDAEPSVVYQRGGSK